jgi:hypothetical protein
MYSKACKASLSISFHLRPCIVYVVSVCANDWPLFVAQVLSLQPALVLQRTIEGGAKSSVVDGSDYGLESMSSIVA